MATLLPRTVVSTVADFAVGGELAGSDAPATAASIGRLTRTIVPSGFRTLTILKAGGGAAVLFASAGTVTAAALRAGVALGVPVG